MIGLLLGFTNTLILLTDRLHGLLISFIGSWWSMTVYIVGFGLDQDDLTLENKYVTLFYLQFCAYVILL